MTKESREDKQQGNAWQRVQLARRPDRPHTLDYVRQLCTDFVELHGDRHFGDDPAIVGGLAAFEGRTVMVIGHQKGTTTKENLSRNFAQAMPEGYRKALRLMRHAEKFGFPLITFIDTPGANPGIESEERGQAQAIADNLMAMLMLQVPIISIVIGEGGSGGALAIGVADRILMLENAIYSVASPEASAAILWHDAGQARAAAEAMKITAEDLQAFGVVDEIIPEPPGGAHQDAAAVMEATRLVLLRHLSDLEDTLSSRGKPGIRKMIDRRHAKYKNIGVYLQGGEDEATDQADIGPALEAAPAAGLNGNGPLPSAVAPVVEVVEEESATAEPAEVQSRPGRGSKTSRKRS